MRSEIHQKYCFGLGTAVGPQLGCRDQVPSRGLGAKSGKNYTSYIQTGGVGGGGGGGG